MCGYEFKEYHLCIKCKQEYNPLFIVYGCTPPRGTVCTKEERARIPPLIHLDFACSDCKEASAAKSTDEKLTSKCKPLLWDEHVSHWSSIW